MGALKNPKSPEEYNIYFLALPQFSDPEIAATDARLRNLSRRSFPGRVVFDHEPDGQPGR